MRYAIYCCTLLEALTALAATIREDTQHTTNYESESEVRKRAETKPNAKFGPVFRDYIKIGAYFGAGYVYLERHNIFGKNKVTTQTLNFVTTSMSTDYSFLSTIAVPDGNPSVVPTPVNLHAPEATPAATPAQTRITATLLPTTL